MPKPSRHGEVKTTSDFLGREVQRWFLQLRRLQSLCHALKANKQTADAQIYRASLWRAIREAKGFQGAFKKWWPRRPVRLQGSPFEIPDNPPSSNTASLMFEDFQVNFRKLESWHARRRNETLRLHLEAHTDNLFSMVKPQPKGALVHLEEEHAACIIGVSDDRTTVHLDQDIPCFEPGDELVATQHYATVPEIQGKLESFWKKRWWVENTPTKEEWSRVLAFGKAYLPNHTLKAKPLLKAIGDTLPGRQEDPMV